MVIFHSYVSLPEGSHVMCVNLAVENRGHGNLVLIKLAIFPMAPMGNLLEGHQRSLVVNGG